MRQTRFPFVVARPLVPEDSQWLEKYIPICSGAVLHKPDGQRQLENDKGEYGTGHGNLDKTFPAATERPPGPLDVAMICTSEVEKEARSRQGTGTHLPTQLEGQAHELLAAPSSPETAQSVAV